MCANKLSEHKRQQIIDAALIEFQLNGFKSSSMDAITRRADVSKRTVYNHFPSKAELFISAVFYAHEQMHRVVNTVFNPDLDLRQQLETIALQEIQILLSEELLKFARMLLAELISNPQMTELLESKRPSFEDKFDLWLKQAIEHGQLSIVDFELANHHFFGVLKSSVFWPTLLQGKKFSSSAIKSIAKSTVNLFLNTYAVNPDL